MSSRAPRTPTRGERPGYRYGVPMTSVRFRLVGPAAAVVLAAGVGGCGSSKPDAGNSGVSPRSASTTTSSSTRAALPGTGKPLVTIGDKNYTEQFVLGELYRQALSAQGYNVVLNRNIGPTEVTIPALESGRLDMYPEYLGTWDTTVAGYKHQFRNAHSAYLAGQRFALAHGLQLLDPTPFSDTDAVGVARSYAVANDLSSLTDLGRVAPTLTFGAPPQFQQSPTGLPAIEQRYGFTPALFKPLEIGSQYQALDNNTVQAATVNTTDGQLAAGAYKLLRDPRHVFGWGNAVPVVSAKVLLAEGPAFEATIDRVSGLLTTDVMRRLNAAVDVSHEDPAAVAKQFLQSAGVIPATAS
jgi:osmoprotectant transport system substrate-binding protein